MEINSENRNSIISTRNSSNNCNNTLIDFDFICRNKIENFIRHYSQPRQLLLNWLFDYSLINNVLLRSFARNYLGISIRNLTILNIINEIHNYYCQRYSISDHSIIQTVDLFESIPYTIQEESQIEINTGNLIDIFSSIENINNIQNNKKFHITTKIIENSIDFENENECFICYEKHFFKKIIKLNCDHEFCKDCIKSQIKNTITENVHCALCRIIVDNFEIRDNLVLEEINNLLI